MVVDVINIRKHFFIYTNRIFTKIYTHKSPTTSFGILNIIRFSLSFRVLFKIALAVIWCFGKDHKLTAASTVTLFRYFVKLSMYMHV